MGQNALLLTAFAQFIAAIAAFVTAIPRRR
jgi:hypothetical protein